MYTHNDFYCGSLQDREGQMARKHESRHEGLFFFSAAHVKSPNG
jgi:hypothetical protein